MPFTLAHPAAIIPLHKVFGRRASLSALIIGSMTPDLVYFLPLGITGRVSHGIPAVLWFCMPAGLLAFLLFHYFAKRPAASLLPLAISHRLPAHALDYPRLNAGTLAVVLVSLACGAMTHIVWDAFTHRHTFIVSEYALLRTVLLSAWGHELRLYKLLQYMSSIGGLLVLAWWLGSWMRQVPLSPRPRECWSLPFKKRLSAIAFIVCAALIYGVIKAVAAMLRPVEYIAVRGTVGMLVGAGCSFTIFCLGWHLFHIFRRRF